jgi:RHS repeat-associated protein
MTGCNKRSTIRFAFNAGATRAARMLAWVSLITLIFPLQAGLANALGIEMRRAAEQFMETYGQPALIAVSALWRRYHHPNPSGASKPGLVLQETNGPDSNSSVDHFFLCPRTLQLYVGEDFNFNAIALTSNDDVTLQGISPSWSTSDDTIVTIDDTGLVTTVGGIGTATINCTAGSGVASADVTVSAGPRPVLSDADWDAAHADDCSDPESNSMARPGRPKRAGVPARSSAALPPAPSVTDRKGQASQRKEGVNQSKTDQADTSATPSASQMDRADRSGRGGSSVAKPATGNPVTTNGSNTKDKATAPRIQPVAFRAARQPLSNGREPARAGSRHRGAAVQTGGPPVETGPPASTITNLIALAARNANGKPRLVAAERAQGSPTKLKNIYASSNYTFTAPVLSLPGRGVGTELALVYNSQLWGSDPSGTDSYFNMNDDWPAPGWSLGVGHLFPNYNGSGINGYPGDFLLVEADGTRRVIIGTQNVGSTVWNYAVTDGSLITMTYATQASGNPTKVRYPDGTVVSYQYGVSNRLLPGFVQSRNGDQITISHRAKSSTFPSHYAIDTITDTLGRTITFHYYSSSLADPNDVAVTGNGPNAALQSISVTGQSGNSVLTQTLVILDYVQVPISFNASASISLPVGLPTAIWGMNSITYPQTGRGYTFSGYSTYGMPNVISTRQGMNGSATGCSGTGCYGTAVASTTYNYPNFSDGVLSGPPQFTTRTETWTGTDSQGNTTSSSATYTYCSSGPSTNPETFTVVSPDGSEVVTTSDNGVTSFSYGKVLSVSVGHAGTAQGGCPTLQTTLSSTSYFYTENGMDVAKVTTSLDSGPTSVTTYAYDSMNRLTTTTDKGFTGAVVRTTNYSYFDDANGDYANANMVLLVSKVTVQDPSGNNVAKSTFSYDDTGPMGYTTAIPSSHASKFTSSYLIRGNLTTSTQFIDTTNTVVKTTAYDIFGNVLNAQVDCCMSKSYTYTSSPMFYSAPATETDGSDPSLMSSFSYFFHTSKGMSVTDPTNNPTSYLYDAAWRLQTTTLPTQANIISDFDSDSNGNDLLSYTSQTKYNEPDGTPKTLASRSWFDGAGHTIRNGSAPGVQSAYDVTAMTYDSMGRMTNQYNPYAGDANGHGTLPLYRVSFAFDFLQRVNQTTLQDRNTVSVNYGSINQAQTMVQTQTVTDQVGREKQLQYDGLGRLTAVLEQDPSVGGPPSTSMTTSYSYDLLDNKIQSSQGGQLRTFTYDQASRPMTVTTPEARQVSYSYYTGSNLMQTRTDARSVVTTYGYDGLNQLSSVSYNTTGTTAVTTPSVTIVPNTSGSGIGQPRMVTDGAGTETYSYDSFGRLSGKSRMTDSNTYGVTYTYNQVNQLGVTGYPSGKEVRLDYDGDGRLKGEDKLTSTGLLVSSYLSGVTYNSAGQGLTATLGNSVAETYGYAQDRQQLTSQGAKLGATSLMSLSYNYLASAEQSGTATGGGNSGQLMDISGTTTTQTRSEDFTYDNVGRLSTAQGWSTWQRRYSYDRWGNRLGVWNATSGGTQIESTALSSPSGFPATNQYTSVTNNGVTLNQSYDASGNLTNDGVHSYVYDAEGRLVTVDQGSANEADYIYDANNWRVKRTTGAGATTTYYVWSAGQVIAEYSNAAATGTAGVMYYHQDQLSTRLITGPTGPALVTEDVYPFGEDAGASPAGLADKHRFTDYERDAESGVDYGMNRHYGSTNGRFMQPDVIAGSLHTPQSLNRYSYTVNDPKNLSDPSGLQYVDGGPDGPPQGTGTDEDPIRLQGWGQSPTTQQYGDPDAGTALVDMFGGQTPNPGGPNLPIGQIPVQSPGPPPFPVQPSKCLDRVLAVVNHHFGTNFTTANIVGQFMNPAEGQPGSGYNLVITADNLPADIFNSIQTGRYPLSPLTYIIGYGATLHIAGPGLFDKTAQFNNSNAGGITSVTFTAHIDTSFPYTPAGVLSHLLKDIYGLGGRNPCP